MAQAPRPTPERRQARLGMGLGSRLGTAVLKGLVLAYRYSLSLLVGRTCRYLPTCSEYALAAIDENGPWRGFWLAVARVSRCHPWGGAGFDPAPDIRHEHYGWAPWRYGRWRMPPRN